jgi:hypothetical protein
VTSEPDLPELRLRENDGGLAELVIRFADVPETLESAVLSTPFVSVSNESLALITVAPARFLVRDGAEILIRPAKSAEPSEVRLFLWDMAFAVLCHQRGLFPLHAACVEFEGSAVALAGASATGKSTLAAALAIRGHRVLADDVCAVDVSAPGRPAVIPAVSFVNLWEDSLDRMGARGPDAECLRQGMEKYQVSTGEPPRPAPALPLRAVLGLIIDPMARQADFVPLYRFQAMSLLAHQVSLRRTAIAMGRSDSLFRASHLVAKRSLVGRLRRPRDWGDLPSLADVVESALPV